MLKKRAKCFFFSAESQLNTLELNWMNEDNSTRGHTPLARVKSFKQG